MTFFVIAWVKDIWYVWIKGMHKHKFVRIDNIVHDGVSTSRFQCPGCKKIINLDPWQVAELFDEDLYERVVEIVPPKEAKIAAR